MNQDDAVFIDPYLKTQAHPARLPDDLRFLCAFEIATGVDKLAVLAFARRTDARDELWIVNSLDWAEGADVSWMLILTDAGKSRPALHEPSILSQGCAVSLARQGRATCAHGRMLGLFLRALGGFSPPGKLLYPGLVTASDFQDLIQTMEQEHPRQTTKEATEIVRLAQELALAPRSKGTRPDAWQARCPGTNHLLEIQATRNLFYCGYCRRGGSLAELRALAGGRRNPYVR
jgi:hypothetical protein